MKNGKNFTLRNPLTRKIVVEKQGNHLVTRWSPKGNVGYRTRPVWVQKIYEGDKDG